MKQIVRTGEDSRPWYRQFWPWFLIAMLGSVVVACVITIRIAFQNPDSIVRDNYYRDGLVINQELAASQRARDLQLSALLAWDAASGQVEIRMQGEPVVAAGLVLALVHPRHASDDIELILRAVDERLYATTLPESLPQQLQGKWELQLNPQAGEEWQLRGWIDFRTQHAVLLEP